MSEDNFEIPMEPTSDNTLSCCDPSTKEFLLKNHDKWTVKQMRAIVSYVSNKMSSLINASEEDCTIEDFEKVKNNDIDSDNEEGEKL